MKERDGRSRRTAPNPRARSFRAGSGAIEGTVSITTSRIQCRKTTGPKQIGVNVQFFATTPNLQRILRAESQQPYLDRKYTLRPWNAFRDTAAGRSRKSTSS
jgi:hypothetical protein